MIIKNRKKVLKDGYFAFRYEKSKIDLLRKKNINIASSIRSFLDRYLKEVSDN